MKRKPIHGASAYVRMRARVHARTRIRIRAQTRSRARPDSSAGSGKFLYDAFGSYSTRADYRLVRRVEGFLESFHQLPNPEGTPLPELAVCVDGSDFSVAKAAASARRQHGASRANIEDEIQRLIIEKLGESKRLLLFCPGRERQGPWMDWEIEWWDANRGWDSVFIAITGGRAPWSNPDTFFPKKVVEHGLHKRIAYDLRGYNRWQRWWWKGVRDFDEELARLAADLYDRSLGEVQPVWFRERQRALRRAVKIRTAVAVATALLAAYALLQRNLAEERRQIAERQTRLATARQLAAQSSAALGQGFPQRSLLLSIEALRVTEAAGEPHIPDAEQALRAGLARVGGTVLRKHEKPVWTLAAAPDGRWLATGSEDGHAILWDLTKSEPIQLGKRGNAVEQAHFSPDGRWLATAQRNRTISVWDLHAQDFSTAPVTTDTDLTGVVKICFSQGSRWLAVTHESGDISLFDLNTHGTPLRVLESHRNPVTDLAFTPDGQRLVTASDKQTFSEGTAILSMETAARVWDLRDTTTPPQLLVGHRGSVNCLCIAADGNRLLTGGSDGMVFLWDLSTQPVSEIWRLPGHTKGVGAVAFSPDGRWAASGDYDAAVKLWDLKTTDPARAAIILAGNSGTVRDVEFSSNGKWLLTHGSKDNDARLWDMTTMRPGVQPTILRGHSGLIQVANLSKDARWALTASDDKSVRLWDLEATDPAAAPLIFSGHEDPVAAAVISENGRCLAIASGTGDFLLPRRDCTTRVWDLHSPQPAASPELLRTDADSGSANVQAGGGWIAASVGDSKVRIWRRSDHATFLLDTGNERLSVITFSQDRRWLAVASQDGTAWLLDLTQSDPTAKPFRLESGGDALLHAEFSPDSRWLATGDNENTAIIWNLNAANPSTAGHALRGHADGITALVWSTDSRQLITAGSNSDRTVRVWDMSTVPPDQPHWTFGPLDESVELVALSPDSRWLTATELNRGTVRVWDLRAVNPAAVPVLQFEHDSETQAIAISPDSRWLASASRGEGVRVHLLPPNSAPGIVLPVLTSEARAPVLAFSHDGRHLAFTADEDLVWLWETGLEKRAPIPLRGHGDDVTDLVFTPDGKQVISGSADGSARVWSTANPTSGQSLVLGSSGGLLSLDVTADGQWIITGASDGIRIWPIGVGALTEMARRAAGRELRPDEVSTFLPPSPPVATTLGHRLTTWWEQLSSWISSFYTVSAASPAKPG